MARKSGDQRSGKDRRGPQRTGPSVSRRTIKRDEDSSQLLERGEGPTAEEVLDQSVPDNRGMRGTGGEGGFSTLGGGVYPDEGSMDDAPSYGDWQRHSTGAGSGARGPEGLGNPGENTWGEERYSAERQEEQGRRTGDKGQRPQRRSDETLAQEIREILTNDSELDSSEIEVEVVGGAVTIGGVVDDSDAKLLAEELVESVTGVREVHNRLRVER